MEITWEIQASWCDWHKVGLQEPSMWILARNKSRLVAQGYTEVEALDFGETYALIASLEVIKILLAYACAHDIRLYQMNLTSAFLNALLIS